MNKRFFRVLDTTEFSPRMDNGRVAWTGLRDSKGGFEHADIYVYDLNKKIPDRITDQVWIQAYPDISGDRVVWQDSRACGNPTSQFDLSQVDVWMFDIKTRKEHQVTAFDGYEGDPQIVGDRVYYLRRVPGEKYVAIFEQKLSALGL